MVMLVPYVGLRHGSSVSTENGSVSDRAKVEVSTHARRSAEIDGEGQKEMRTERDRETERDMHTERKTLKPHLNHTRSQPRRLQPAHAVRVWPPAFATVPALDRACAR